MIDFRLMFESAVIPICISLILFLISPQMLPVEAYFFFTTLFSLITYLFVETFRIDREEEMQKIRQKYVNGEIDVSDFEENMEKQLEKET